MLISNSVRVATLLVCVGMAGCAIDRSEIKLSSPETMPASTDVASARTAVIRSVQDERTFEERPEEPSTPSLGFGGADKASSDIKARAIGRKRNGWGKALGDVLLENGQTVEGLVREHLAAALVQAGYQVTDEGAGASSPLVIDVHIKQFWAWFQPGFWSITLSTNITTDLDISGAESPTTIRVHQEENRQLATETAWMEIVGKALDDYRAQVVRKAAAFP